MLTVPIAVTTAVIVVIALSVAASAHNFGAGATQERFNCVNRGSTDPKEWKSECTTEDKYWYVYSSTLVDAWFRDALQASIYEDYVPVTDFYAYWQTGYSSNTDVYVLPASVSHSDPYGIYTTCEPASIVEEGGGVGLYRYCDEQYLIYDFDHPFTENVRDTPGRADWAACHELGHTAGLAHPAANNNRVTCMDYAHDTNDLDEHDVEHLNDCYPRPSPYPTGLTLACRD